MKVLLSYHATHSSTENSPSFFRTEVTKCRAFPDVGLYRGFVFGGAVAQVDHDMLIRIVKSKQEILKCLEKKLQKYFINCL